MTNYTKRPLIISTVLVTFQMLAFTSYADVNWDGSESGDWGDPANWVENTIPSSSDSVYLNANGNSPTNQNIVGLDIMDLWFDIDFTSGINLDGESIALNNIRTPDNGVNVAYHKILCDITMKENLDMYIQDNITVELAGVMSDGGNGYNLESGSSHGTTILSGTNNTYGGYTKAQLGTLKFYNDQSLGTPPAVPTPDFLLCGFGSGPIVYMPDDLNYRKITINANRGMRKLFVISGACEVSYGGAISSGEDFEIRFTDGKSGIMRLSGTSTTDNNINMSGNNAGSEGLIILESSSALGSTNGYTQSTDVTIDLNGQDIAEPITQYGAGLDDNGNFVNMNLNDTSVLSGTATLAWDYLAHFFGGRGDIIQQGNVLENQVGGVSGPRKMHKFGSGTLTLQGSNFWSGSTSLTSGRVILDHTVDNNAKLGVGTTFEFGNCGLELIGNDSQPCTETITAMIVHNAATGAGYISVVAGNADANFSFDDFYQNSSTHPYYGGGGTLDFRTKTTGTGTARIVGRSVANDATSGILSCAYTYNNGRTWATVDAGSNIVGLANGAYVDTMSNNEHVDVPTGTLTLSANTTVESLRFASDGQMTIDCNGKTLYLKDRRSAYGMIMSPDATADAEIIGGDIKGTGYNNPMRIHQYNTNYTLTISARIRDSVNLGVTKAGPGEVILNNDANDYDAATTVGEGTLTFTSISNRYSVSSLGKGDNYAYIYLGTATLKYIGSGDSSDRTVELRGMGTIEAAGSGLLHFTNLGNTITSTAGSQTLILSGAGDGQIDGAVDTGLLGGLFKRGTGTWTLNGTNLYRYPTVIENGTLEVNGSMASDVDVQSGATLKSSGATFARNLTVDGTLSYENIPTSGEMIVQGYVVLNGTLEVTNSGGDLGTIITSDHPITGTFTSITEGYKVTYNTYSIDLGIAPPTGTLILIK